MFEQINSAYSKKVAINIAFPIPVKKEIKSQPVLMNSICITDGNVTCSIAAKLGSFWKAVISAGKSKNQCSVELNMLSRTTHSRSVPATIGRPM